MKITISKFLKKKKQKKQNNEEANEGTTFRISCPSPGFENSEVSIAQEMRFNMFWRIHGYTGQDLRL